MSITIKKHEEILKDVTAMWLEVIEKLKKENLELKKRIMTSDYFDHGIPMVEFL